MGNREISNDDLLELRPWLHDFKLPAPLSVPIDEYHRRRIWQRRNHIMPAVLQQFEARDKGLAGLTVLDLGANAGFWGRSCAEHGASVTCVEPREINCKQGQIIAKICGDLDIQWEQKSAEEFLASTQRRFDIVLCLGLLYHVADPATLLRKCADHTNDFLVVDSHCINDDGAIMELRQENAHESFQGISEIITIPSRGAIYWLIKRLEFSHILELPNVGDVPDDYLRFERHTFLARRHKSLRKLSDKEPLCLTDKELEDVYHHPPASASLKRSQEKPRTADFYARVLEKHQR